MADNPFASDQELMQNVVDRFRVMGIRVADGRELRSFPGAFIKCTADTIKVYDSTNTDRLVGTVDLQGNITCPPAE